MGIKKYKIKNVEEDTIDDDDIYHNLEEENIFLYSQLSFFSLTTYFILLPILEWNVTLHFFC